jgi:hypothetical protein
MSACLVGVFECPALLAAWPQFFVLGPNHVPHGIAVTLFSKLHARSHLLRMREHSSSLLPAGATLLVAYGQALGPPLWRCCDDVATSVATAGCSLCH